MANELYLEVHRDGVNIALLKEKRLVEFHKEKNENGFAVGDIFNGTVKKVMPGLNAAFIDVGHEKDAFLHYLDLGPQYKTLQKFAQQARQNALKTGALDQIKLEGPIEKTGKIGNILQKGQPILVQVSKEPIASKGPRLSSEISLAGSFLVLVPFSNVVSISKKIKTNEERNRLKRLVETLKPKNFGVIVRTVAEDKSSEELEQDIKLLLARWEQMTEAIRNAKGVKKVLSEVDRSFSLIRDLLSYEFDAIVVDDKDLYDNVKKYLHTVDKDKERILRLHNAKESVFEHYDINKKVKLSFGKNVPIQGGSYLVVEHTEALHVIDVNSGSKSITNENQEEQALGVNMEAAAEIARQLRLRDMGGIIVIDFIDLKTPGARKKLHDKLEAEMKDDRAKHTILPMSRFGLMQITRQRVRPEIQMDILEVCPTCNGTGQIQPSVLITETIEQTIKHLAKELNYKSIILNVHPFIAAYYTKGIISRRFKWFLQDKIRVQIFADASFDINEFHFLNPQGEEIKLN